MARMLIVFAACLLLASHTLARSIPSPALEKRAATITTAWKLLYQNDADWTRANSNSRQVGYLLYSGNVNGGQVASTCSTLNEAPASVSSNVEVGLKQQLLYLIYDGSYKSGQAFWVKSTHSSTSTKCSIVTVTTTTVTFGSAICSSNSYPVICSQSATRTTAASATPTASLAVNVQGLTAYRDAFSFRFLQVPFANTPQRFSYSSVYTGGTAGTSSTCPAPGGSTNEDCLVGNIYTPVIAGGTNVLALKPIMMWVYGGGFTTGSGQDPTFDGGSLASRGDVVVFTPNYRLGTLGFLSVNNQAPGNYALSDLITALKWIKANAAKFGGDANRITVFGQSAGAQLVESLLSSPAASGLFQGAIVQSGRPADVANAKISAAGAQAGPAGATISALGCSGKADVLGCLRGLPVSNFFSNVFARQVVDGNLITQPNLDVANRMGGYVNKVPVIWGHMRDELGALGYAPPTSQQNLDAALSSAGITQANRSIVENNPSLFPVGSASNAIQNLTVTVNTDINSISRCGQEATINSAASTNFFSAIYGYIQNQRSYQIKGYDPNNVCTSTTSATSGYYLCHSGDLYPVFNTAGYAGQYPERDADDVVHSALMMDYWTSFARSGNPNPSSAYLTARGYTTTASRINGKTWNPTTSSNLNFLSLGPYPSMIPLAQRGPQCSALNKPINYIANGQ